MGDETSWEVRRPRGSTTVVVTFRGKVDPVAGRDSAFRFLEVMGDERVNLAFHVRDVQGYSNQARKHWQSALWPRRKQILSLTVASSSQLTRMGAFMFARFLGVPCHVQDRLDV